MKPQEEHIRRLAQRRISKSIRDARTGMSQAEAASRAGISEEFMGRIERGEALPSIPTLMRIVWLLGLDAGDIFRTMRPPA